MDPHLLVATMLWGGFQLSIIALIAGVIAAHRDRRTLALLLLFLAVAGTLAFSYAGGFSIGRFTAAIPVLIIGYVVAMGRGAVTVASSMIGAALVYLACSWLLTPLVFGGAVPFVLFEAWAIPLYTVLALAAFGWAVLNRPRHT